MLLDKEALFSNDQSLVATAGAILSTYSIDVGAAGTMATRFNAPVAIVNDIGKGFPILVLVQVTATFDSAGDAVTTYAELVTADDEALTSNLVVISKSATFAQSIMVAGYQFMVPGIIPPGTSADRYIGMRYTTAVADATAGTVTAGLVFSKQTAP